MKGDFSRQTFRPGKRYSGVLMQQGRVQLDADWNEQQAINRHRIETAEPDIVGPSGAPKVNPGFEIALAGNDLQIGRGHFYVGGLLCENDDDVLFTAQPDPPVADDAAPIPLQDGLFVAYLDAWERHITALEDETIKETALAGPDTATRTKTVWQVRLLQVTDPGGTVTCATAFAEWTALLRRNGQGDVAVGRLRARSGAEEPSPDPLCILPPEAGYRRLENQLYRVEVHTGGDRAQARFKWSRDNGTVASAIVPDENDIVVDGSTLVVAEIGKDGMLTFATDPLPEWVELTDDRLELADQHGTLARVQSVDPPTRTITLAPGPLPSLRAGAHPVLRRWDQRGDTADASGVPMTGDWQPLEDGVEVRFDDGVYREGDFWLIPARTALGVETGSVHWPVDAQPVPQPVPLPPEGVRHRLARLALVRRSGGTLSVVPGTDCRRLFPPLTAIQAVDVGFDDSVAQLGVDDVQEALDALAQRSVSICTLLVGPGEDLALALNRIAGVQDALICLRAGTYELTAPLVIENRGHIQVAGAGPGTRIVAPSSEVALLFRNCASAKVSNLSVETGTVGHGPPASDIDGSLTFVDCGSATVDGASVSCAGGPVRAGACVTIRRGAPLDGSRARIDGCDLAVGHLQVGALVVSVDIVRMTNNVVRPGARPDVAVLLAHPGYRALLRPSFLSTILPALNPVISTNATVAFAGRTLFFRTDSILATTNEWQRAMNLLAPQNISQTRQLKRALVRMASTLIAARGAGALGSARFQGVVNAMLAQDTTAAGQGLVVGGARSSDVRIEDNTVRDAVQGIHVGTGGSAGVVLVERNTIRVSLPTSASRDRHGVFVSDCDSLVLARNHISLVRTARTQSVPIEAIRVVGILGQRAIIRENHIGPRFTVGVSFAALNQPLPTTPLWLLTDNMMESASAKFLFPGTGGRPGATNPAQVSSRVRGLEGNFA